MTRDLGEQNLTLLESEHLSIEVWGEGANPRLKFLCNECLQDLC